MALMQQGMSVNQAGPPTMASMLEPQQGDIAPPNPAPDTASDPGYNGMITYQGQTYQVVNGDVNIDGEVGFLTSDGAMLVDQNKQILGYLEGTVIKPMDAAHLLALQQRGLVEGVK